jgi:hypothetical protein
LYSIDHGAAAVPSKYFIDSTIISSQQYVGYPGALAWLKARHEGKPIEPGCRSANVNVSSFQTLLPGESALATRVIIQNVLAMLGVRINDPPIPW